MRCRRHVNIAQETARSIYHRARKSRSNSPVASRLRSVVTAVSDRRMRDRRVATTRLGLALLPPFFALLFQLGLLFNRKNSLRLVQECHSTLLFASYFHAPALPPLPFR